MQVNGKLFELKRENEPMPLKQKTNNCYNTDIPILKRVN